jgi:hypothetical protein
VRSELLLRAVNERIVEIGANDAAALEILCECGDASCISTVAISVRDYERVRRDSSRFVVSEGHELADIERVNEHPGVPRSREGSLVDAARSQVVHGGAQRSDIALEP